MYEASHKEQRTKVLEHRIKNITCVPINIIKRRQEYDPCRLSMSKNFQSPRFLYNNGLLNRIPHFATESYAFCKRFLENLPKEIFEHILNKALNNRMVDPSIISIYDTHIKLGYMSISYNVLTKVYDHRVTTIAAVEQNIMHQAHEMCEGRCTHCEDMEVLIAITKAIDASPELRSKKQLIENFILGINDVDDVMNEWHNYVVQKREEDLETIITEERMKPEDTRKFLENAFRDGEIKTSGTDIDKLMPPVSRFGGGHRAEKKQSIIDKLKAFFEKYFGIGGSASFTDNITED